VTDLSVWGPLAEPVHGPVPAGRPPWKDNAFLNFWDPEQEVFGCAHVSTSPNAHGRRARVSVSVRGRVVELMEELESGSFRSPSIAFDLEKSVTVESPRLSWTLYSEPLYELADYTAGGVIPPLIPGEPLRHYQRAACVHGEIVLDGETITLAGARGFRDRTWGYRDESVTWSEYAAFLAVFDDHALTAMRFHSPDGADATEGYLLGALGQPPRPVTGIAITRDASGLAAAARFALEDGSELELRSLGRVGGFWVPMGWEREGPAMSSYDEFTPVRTDRGAAGFGMFEHGIIRRLY
jgi:hypothetical protein